MTIKQTINSLLILAFCLITAVSAQRGTLVSLTQVGTIQAAEFNKQLREVYPEDRPTDLESSLKLYKITYRSTDVNGRSSVLSGLLVVPQTGAPNGLVIFNHGTMVWKKSLPSMYRGEAKPSESKNAVLAFGSGGYAIAMPDYIGLGDHKTNAHPFPASVVNARAGMDLIKPAREALRREGFPLGSNLFITGYSEGGGVAMALTRMLEQSNNPLHSVTASAPLSGPYDLSGTTLNFMAQRNTDQAGFVVRTFLLGYAIHSLSKNTGLKVNDYFKPSMALTINLAYTGNVSDEDVLKRLGVTGVLMRAKNDIFNIITPKFRRVIESRDRRDPVIGLLYANDCYDWSPKNPMLLVTLVNDTVVSPKNTEVAFETMRRRGVTSKTLRKSIIRDTSLNHLTAMPVALLRARRFFDGGFGAVRDLNEN